MTARSAWVNAERQRAWAFGRAVRDRALEDYAAEYGIHPVINAIYSLSDLACKLMRPNPFFEFWSYSCRCSPLHCAVYNANLPAVEALLELGADVDSRLHVHKMTPLHLAAQGGHTIIAQRLLSGGADPRERSWSTDGCGLVEGGHWELAWDEPPLDLASLALTPP